MKGHLTALPYSPCKSIFGTQGTWGNRFILCLLTNCWHFCWPFKILQYFSSLTEWITSLCPEDRLLPAVLTGLGITYENLHNSIVLQGLCPLIEGILWLLSFLLLSNYRLLLLYSRNMTAVELHCTPCLSVHQSDFDALYFVLQISI